MLCRVSLLQTNQAIFPLKNGELKPFAQLHFSVYSVTSGMEIQKLRGLQMTEYVVTTEFTTLFTNITKALGFLHRWHGVEHSASNRK